MIPIEQINIDIKKDNIIEGIMKSNGLYCLVAEPKVGKSFLALQIANSLTNNKEFQVKDMKKFFHSLFP